MYTRHALRSAWTHRYTAGFAVLVALICVAALNLTACGDVDKPGGGGDPVDRDYEHIYTVRGRVISLPDDTPGSAFMVHHETIPDYVSASGSIGMDSMVMPFALPDPSVIDGLAVGDIIEVVYGESLNPRVKQGVVSARVLPADTVLEFDVDSVDRDYEHIYTVRGRVVALPDGTPGSAFIVHHETIPDYVSASGSIGMDSMVMPFALPDPSVIDGLAVGDIVELVYGESLNPRVKQGVISATVLSADTVLAFDVDPDEDDEQPTDE